MDVKILAKIFAFRLETVVHSIISEDQTGFIRSRHSFRNVRRLLNIVFSPSPLPVPEAVISLDAEKAFDRVEWPYLFFTLKNFGFSDHFISWIRLLYTSPEAAVCTNSLRSSFFPLSRGTRQGCPLSPHLFALAIEPLSIALKTDNLIPGIKRGGVEHKVSLYADDLLLYIFDPVRTIPYALNTLKNFGSFSGYKLNIDKSDFFPLNESAKNILPSSIPFTFSTTKFKYLGINISQTIKSLFDDNFALLLGKVKKDLQKWDRLQITLAGRIQSVKMNIVPRFLYLFQCLLLYIPKSFFTNINSLISSFIWNNKPPRLQKSLLQRARGDGGLGLPDLQHYYWACNLHKILFWAFYSETQWCQLESDSCHHSLMALLCHPEKLKLKQYTDNPIVSTTLKIWQQIKHHYNWETLPNHTPVRNLLFKPAQLDSRFTIWERQGLKTIGDF